MMRSKFLSVVAVGLLATLGTAACSEDPGTVNRDVEVFTWWADGGEKAGLDGLVTQFAADCSQYAFLNGAIAGGAGSNAKQVLASRLAQSDPPDTFQAHAGRELTDYISAGQVEDLSDEYTEWGLTDAFPQGLIDNLTVDGKIYSVQANIHRANVLWGNKTVLASAGITAPATTIDGFIADLEKLKQANVTPLALGRDWTQLMLFESVLISDLGASAFTGLWDGTTSWDSAGVDTAIAHYQTLLS